MSESCCQVELSSDPAQKRAILLVLGINLVFFFAEGIAGIMAQSSSLLADAVDMGGDAFVYFLSYLALSRGLRAKSKVALFNASFELVLGISVLIEVFTKLFREVQPISSTMFVVGGLALLANLVSGGILLAHRHKDINMKAVWMCTRNDVINNLVTLLAAGGVHYFGMKWPDIIGGFLIAGLIVFFSTKVLVEALKHLNGQQREQN